MKTASATAESNMQATLQQHDTKVSDLNNKHKAKVAQLEDELKHTVALLNEDHTGEVN